MHNTRFFVLLLPYSYVWPGTQDYLKKKNSDGSLHSIWGTEILKNPYLANGSDTFANLDALHAHFKWAPEDERALVPFTRPTFHSLGLWRHDSRVFNDLIFSPLLYKQSTNG